MEQHLSRLVGDYESGRLTRRQLIQTLAAVTAAGHAMAAEPTRGFKAIGVDHLSYRVSDYQKTRDFYVDLLGMKVTSEDAARKTCVLGFGDSMLVIRSRNDVPATPVKSTVDHFSVWIDDWNTERVKAELERRGHAPRFDPNGGPGYASFHVTDPDGYDLQIAGKGRS